VSEQPLTQPAAQFWRLPVIRHVRWLIQTYRINRWYEMWRSLGSFENNDAAWIRSGEGSSDMPDYFEDVGRFHQKFGLPIWRDRSPHVLSPEEFMFRYRLIQEEAHEFGDAWAKGDLPGQVDAICDLIYVTVGAAHYMGVDLDAHWAIVQRANMAKVRASGPNDPLGKRGSALDVVKPPGWTPPDHSPLLR
jgi:predicted HAD superfamily Cof-like phosphohydrolase